MEYSYTIPFLPVHIDKVRSGIEKIQQSPSSIYSVLNAITNFDWNFSIDVMNTYDNGLTFHVVVSVTLGTKTMIGVGTSSQGSSSPFESAVGNAIESAILKMLPIDTTEENKVSNDNVVREATQGTRIPEVPKEEQPTTPTPPAENQEQAKKNGFSKEQIAKMMKFKNDFNIMNEQQFLSHLKAWNPLITSKLEINPNNIEDFFKYVDDLMKEDF